MGADLLAAEAAADASVALRLAGDVRGSAAGRRAGKLVERCEGPVTPALQAVRARARLTPSERETAVLAAGGRTNKEIAEQVFLPPAPWRTGSSGCTRSSASRVAPSSTRR